MKGFEIKRENEKPIYLFNRYDVVSAIAYAIYYTANPETDMCIPNCAYERAEKEFDDWFNDTRIEKAIETLNEDDKPNKAEEYATRECCTTCNNINHFCKEKCECWTFAKKGVEFGLKQHSHDYLVKTKKLRERIEYLEAENKRLKNEIIQKCYPEQMEIIKGVSN